MVTIGVHVLKMSILGGFTDVCKCAAAMEAHSRKARENPQMIRKRFFIL